MFETDAETFRERFRRMKCTEIVKFYTQWNACTSHVKRRNWIRSINWGQNNQVLVSHTLTERFKQCTDYRQDQHNQQRARKFGPDLDRPSNQLSRGLTGRKSVHVHTQQAKRWGGVTHWRGSPTRKSGRCVCGFLFGTKTTQSSSADWKSFKTKVPLLTD